MKGVHDNIYTPHKDNDTLRLNLLKHIVRCPLFRSMWRQHFFLLFAMEAAGLQLRSLSQNGFIFIY
jgi:hypothetical protein